MKNESVNPNAKFEELVESYINGTITEEQAKELLDMVRADEKLQVEFAGQLQVSHLLETKETEGALGLDEKILPEIESDASCKNNKKHHRLHWSSVIIRIAAILMVVFVISHYVDFSEKDEVKPEQQVISVAPYKYGLDSEQNNLPVYEESKKKEKGRLGISIDGHKRDMDPLMTDLSKSSVSSETDSKEVNESAAPEPQKSNKGKMPGVRKEHPLAQNAAQSGHVDKLQPAASTAEIAAKTEGEAEEREMVPLKIQIPKPQFTGTPKDIRSPNLERPAEKSARVRYPARKAVADSSALHSELRPAPKYLGGRMIAPPPERPRPEQSGESYAKIEENVFLNPKEKPLSTFSIDVDTASYSNLRRMLNNNQLPPVDAVRIEEMINYFEYDYEGPGDEKPFSSAISMHSCPWSDDHRLLRIGLQGRKLEERGKKPSNLVFLLDVSGSMNSHDKLPLLKKGMTMLVKTLSENDRVAIVVYAGNSGLVLDSTSAAEKGRIIDAMERLSAGGSTAGGAGIELAYRVAQDNFIKGGVNRVILATDGDFNVGVSSHGDLEQLIEEKRRSGVFLSVLGFGTGNLQDSKMELLANKGNGNYFYIDSEREAQKVLVKQLNATLVTIAKDVKIQVEFNPEHIKSYRLIGYVNRKMAARDFDDDKKDAGEIGAGHQVTALYEVVPVGAPDQHQGIPLKYGKKDEVRPEPKSDEMLTLKLRYKAPDGDVSKLLEFPYNTKDFKEGSGDESFRWAASVAAFGQILRDSQYIGKYTLNDVRALALDAKGEDPNGYRSEFISLVERAAQLKGEEPSKNDKGYPVWQYRN